MSLPEAFVAAMDDDLGTPAAVAVLYDTVREGNKLLTDGPSAALAPRSARWWRCSACSVSTRATRVVFAGGSDARLTEAVDVLVQGLLTQRADAPGSQGLGPRRPDP